MKQTCVFGKQLLKREATLCECGVSTFIWCCHMHSRRTLGRWELRRSCSCWSARAGRAGARGRRGAAHKWWDWCAAAAVRARARVQSAAQSSTVCARAANARCRESRCNERSVWPLHQHHVCRFQRALSPMITLPVRNWYFRKFYLKFTKFIYNFSNF